MEIQNVTQSSRLDRALPIDPLVVILLAALLAPLVNLGRPRLGSPHEARVVATARNMVASGDWIVPHFNDDIRLQKPPLPYWTVAGLVKVFGPVQEGMFRLPSALMGIGIVVMTFLMGKTAFDRRTGLWAALILALSTKFIIESRLARVDIYLAFWCTASLLILTAIFFGLRRRDWLWLPLGVCVGVAILAKWVNVFMFVLGPVVYGLIVFRERRPRWTWSLACVAALCLVGLSWIVLVIERLGWDTLVTAWQVEIYDNVTSPEHRSNHGVFYYFPQLFVLTMPWSALVPVSLLLPLVPRFRPQRGQLIWWVLVVLVPLAILSLASKKKADYLLPAMPVLALLGAQGWKGIEEEIAPDAPDDVRNPRTPVGLIQPALLLATALATVAFALWDRHPERMAAAFVGGLGLAAGGGLALRAVLKGRGERALLFMGAGAAVFSLLVFGVLVPRITRISSAEFAHTIVDTIGDAPLAHYRSRDDSLIYYVERPIVPFGDAEHLAAYLDEHPKTCVLVQAKYRHEIDRVVPHVVLHEPRFRDMSVPVPGMEEKHRDIYLLSVAPWDGIPESCAGP